MQKIRQFLITLRSSLWLVPGAMVAGAIILALTLIEVDSHIKREWLVAYPRVFGLGADGSRGMLTAIAGSMLTVATLAFSLTLSIIAQASGQYTPRILRNFMRDRVNQFVLGYFVSVFAYSLIILRTIRGADEIKFVPSLGVMVGMLLALGGIAVLIYFIHHITSSLQVTNIIKNIESETLETLDTLFPQHLGEAVSQQKHKESITAKEKIDWYEVKSNSSGYIQYIDTEGLLDFAIDNKLYVKIEYSIGQFVADGTTLVFVSKKLNEDIENTLNGFFNIYRYRTISQDVGYGIGQIVDIALKALSPGINDTTTALNCIDYLSAIIGKIANREMPVGTRMKDNEVFVFANAPDFEYFLEIAFDQIRINAKANLAVFLRLLKAYSIINECTDSDERKELIKKHILLTKEFAEETLQTDYEKGIFSNLLSKELKKIKYKRIIQ